MDIYCADGSTKESILVEPGMTVGGALKLMAEKSCVDCHVKWGLVERLPDLCMERCLEDDEKLLRIVSSWKPQTSNRLVFAQRPEKYDLFRRPERYLLDPYDKATTESVMQSPWDPMARQSLLQRCIDNVREASTTQLEGPLWLKAEGKKSWKKFHFILRDGNLFQTTKSKKGSVHDVHCVASLATVRVFNGLGWKRKHKAPTDFCFALKPPEVQEKKAHIRYLCAENEFIKWGWYSMLRLTLGPPQQLVDNYNAQLGVLPVPVEESSGLLSRSDSITSNGDCSVSSGCVSEEENGFDVDYPDGGTIKRKPQQHDPMRSGQPRMMSDQEAANNLPLPPPPSSETDITPTEASHMPFPPPPMELEAISSPRALAVREELYPCGILRTVFHNESAAAASDHLANGVNQMSLLQQLPSQPPPDLRSLFNNNQGGGGETIMNQKRTRKITFSEYVHSIEDSQWQPLKGREDMDSNAEENNMSEGDAYKEQDVSNWVLESLRHCSPTSSTASSTHSSNSNGMDPLRPRLYNGRTVPNCFSPEEIEARQRLQIIQAAAAAASSTASTTATAASRKCPPPPPRRSNATYLSP